MSDTALADLAEVVKVSASAAFEKSALLERAADWSGLAALLVVLRRARTELALVESDVEAALARTMPGNVVSVDGLGVLERRGGRRRTHWDHRRLASLLAARAADHRFDPETGEVYPPALFAQHVADELLDCASISAWKVTALRARHVDPAGFCEEAEGRASVTIREATC